MALEAKVLSKTFPLIDPPSDYASAQIDEGGDLAALRVLDDPTKL